MTTGQIVLRTMLATPAIMCSVAIGSLAWGTSFGAFSAGVMGVVGTFILAFTD